MIELEIFFNNDDTVTLDRLDLPVRWCDYDVRKVTFFNIDAISPHIEEGRSYSKVHCGGDMFLCNMDYDLLVQKIKNKI